jgi:tetratricopeptide (TPR) repeat protein
MAKVEHKQARELLDASRAQVIIWGIVLKLGQAAVPKLHWTVNKDLEGIKEFGRYPVNANDLDLPPIFWEDVQNVLTVLTLNEAAEYAKEEEGHYIADRLKPFIGRVRDLIQRAESKQAWTGGQRVQMENILANALSRYGEQAGDNAALTEAVAAYRAALQECPRERVPLDWAMTQNNLGTALTSLGITSLGERESSTRRLEEAIIVLREALKERTRERVPLDWAATQYNLGVALQTLGERESGTVHLEEAVAAFQKALSVFEVANVPPYIEGTRRNLQKATQVLAARNAH